MKPLRIHAVKNDLCQSENDTRHMMRRQRAEIVDLYARCAELESVKLQLDRETEKCNAKVSQQILLFYVINIASSAFLY